MSDVQATDNTTTEQATQAAADAAANAVANTPTPADMPATKAEPDTVDSLPTWAQSLIKDLRDENGKHRNKAKTAAEEAAQREKELATQARDQLVNDLAKALGIGGEDEQDPQALLDAANEKTAEQEKRIDELLNQVNGYKREQAIDKAIGNRNVNKRLLKAVLASDNALNGLDVTSDNFADQVSEAVNDAIKNTPELVQATPGKSGIDPTNTKTDQPITREDLNSMSAEDINKAVRDGRLDHLLKK